MIFVIFIIGSILGSFYLVVSTRLPNKEDIVFSRSHCDNCHVILKWYQLIPILSYLFQAGKCPKCGKPIAFINLATEIITGILFVVLYQAFGFSYNFFAGAITASLLIIVFISDFKYLIILDSPLIISSLTILFLKYLNFGFASLYKSFLSGLLLFLLMLLIGKMGNKIFKRESLGGGDIKLAAFIGFLLGLRLGLVALIMSSFLALPISLTSIMTIKNNEVPFGPFLIGSTFIVFVFMDKFTNLLNYIFNFL